MDSKTLTVLISGTIGLIAGALGSLVAPWVRWGIEKRRLRHERRLALIERWRVILSGRDFDRRHLLEDPVYGPLRTLLKAEARNEIERPANYQTVVLNSVVENLDKELLLNEVARIEAKWGLV